MSRSYETIRFPLTPMKLKILSASASSVCLHQSIFRFMCLMPNLYSGEINFLYIFLSPTFPSCLEHALFLLLPDCAHFLRLSSYSTPAKITADGDCSHEIKRCLLLGRKAMNNLNSILKSRDITLLTKVCIS